MLNSNMAAALNKYSAFGSDANAGECLEQIDRS
jgi:hypothetical protein